MGFGAGGVSLQQYRSFKARRRETPREIRDAGFWSDSRLYKAEAIFAAVAMAIPFTAIQMAVATNFSFEGTFAATLAYAFSIYMLVSVLNMREHQ